MLKKTLIIILIILLLSISSSYALSLNDILDTLRDFFTITGKATDIEEGRLFNLQSGQHVIKIYAREANTIIDAIEITNDSYTPTWSSESCSILPKSHPGYIRLEAEKGVRTGTHMEILQDDSYSHCSYVKTKYTHYSADEEYLSHEFTIGENDGDNYFVWLKVKGNDWNSNSFFVGIDGGDPFRVEISQLNQLYWYLIEGEGTSTTTTTSAEVTTTSTTTIPGETADQTCPEFCGSSYIAVCIDSLYPSPNPEYTNYKCGGGPYDDGCYKRERGKYSESTTCNSNKRFCVCYTCEEVDSSHCEVTTTTTTTTLPISGRSFNLVSDAHEIKIYAREANTIIDAIEITKCNPQSHNPESECGLTHIRLEAEKGEIHGTDMEKFDSYVKTKYTHYSISENYVSHEFDITDAGNYFIWLKVKANDWNSNSFFVGIDEVEAFKVEISRFNELYWYLIEGEGPSTTTTTTTTSIVGTTTTSTTTIPGETTTSSTTTTTLGMRGIKVTLREPKDFISCQLCIWAGFQWKGSTIEGECKENCKTGPVNSFLNFFGAQCIVDVSGCGKRLLAATPKSEDELLTANPILPSVTGIGVNKFSGSSSVSYPIQLPPGLGISPSLTLSYNSRSVDDSHTGIDDWEETYYHQASWAGLGWNLDGLGYIVRDPSGYTDTNINMWDEDGEFQGAGVNDDRFYLMFPRGSAEIVDPNRGQDHYCDKNKQWKTSPELFLKIEHEHKPCPEYWGSDERGFDTDQWIITTKDGTKYYFGNPNTGDGRFYQDMNENGVYDSGIDYLFPTIAETGSGGNYEVFDSTKSLAVQYGMAKLLKDNNHYNKILPQKWLLRRIEDVHGNTIDIEYETLGKEVWVPGDEWCPEEGCPNFYTHDVRPKRIIYSKNTIEFVWEERSDYKIKDYNSNERINFWTRWKLDEIKVKVGDYLARKYDLDYDQYAYRCNSDEKYHSLLTSITVYGKDGKSSLPPYTFEYYNNYPNPNMDCEDYDQYQWKSFNTALLKSADNGYDGKITFEYDRVNPIVCIDKKRDNCNEPPSVEGGGYWCCSDKSEYGTYRARVNSKIIEDGMGNNYRISYEYGDEGKSYVDNQNNHLPGYKFLGYDWVQENIHELNGGIIVSTKTSYYGLSEEGWEKPDDEGQDDDDYACFKPDPRLGMAYKTEVKDGDTVLTTSESSIVFTTSENSISPDEEDLSCDSIKEHASYFIHPKWETSTIDGKTTKVEYIEWDETYGNLIETLNHGDILIEGDEIKTEVGYNPNPDNWLVSYPAWTKVYDDKDNLVQETRTYYDYQDSYDLQPIKGLVTKTCSGLREDFLCVKTEYNDYGNPTKTWDANTQRSEHYTTLIKYDPSYNIYPVETCNALGQCTEIEYDYVLGTPKKTKDLNGKITEYEYDTFGQLRKVALPGESLSNPSIEYLYYYPGSEHEFVWEDNKPKLVVITKTKIDSTRRAETRQFYNGIGQLVQAQAARVDVEGQTRDIVSSIKYDERGLKQKETLPYAVIPYKPSDNSPYIQEFRYPVTTYEYDALGRVRFVTDPEGRIGETQYQGWTTTIIDPENHKTTAVNDAYGRVKETYLYGNDNQLYKKTENTYDTLGNLITSTFTGYTPTEESFTNTNDYDVHGRLIFQEDVDLGKSEYYYDNNGNLILAKDNKDQIITFDYDKLNRVERRTYPDFSAVDFYYDNKVNKCNSPRDGNGLGRLTETDYGIAWETSGGMEYVTTHTCYYYDDRGRTTTMVKNISGDEAIFGYTYYDNNAVHETTYPDGEVVTNELDSTGRLKKVQGRDTYLSDIVYDVYGNPRTITYGNDVITTYDYNLVGWLTNTRTYSGTDLINKNYPRNDIGYITDIRDSVDSHNLHFVYDSIGRLTDASGYYDAHYEYDSLDRMTTKTEDTTVNMQYTNPEHIHAPNLVNDKIYEYDKNGNTLVFFSPSSEQTDISVFNAKLSLQRRSDPSTTVDISFHNSGEEVALYTIRDVSVFSSGSFYIEVPEDWNLPTQFEISIKTQSYLGNRVEIKNWDHDKSYPVLDFGTLKAGDVNGDDKINMADVNFVGSKFLKKSSDPDWNEHKIADLNDDGVVNIYDMVLVGGNIWKSSVVMGEYLPGGEGESYIRSEIRWNYDNKPEVIRVGSSITTFEYDGDGNRIKKTVG